VCYSTARSDAWNENLLIIITVALSNAHVVDRTSQSEHRSHVTDNICESYEIHLWVGRCPHGCRVSASKPYGVNGAQKRAESPTNANAPLISHAPCTIDTTCTIDAACTSLVEVVRHGMQDAHDLRGVCRDVPSAPEVAVHRVLACRIVLHEPEVPRAAPSAPASVIGARKVGPRPDDLEARPMAAREEGTPSQRLAMDTRERARGHDEAQLIDDSHPIK
jgi:hypothetical protein